MAWRCRRAELQANWAALVPPAPAEAHAESSSSSAPLARRASLSAELSALAEDQGEPTTLATAWAAVRAAPIFAPPCCEEFVRYLLTDSLDTYVDPRARGPVRLLTVDRGTHVYRPGQPSESLFVVARGRVQVQSKGIPLHEAGPGEHFGDQDLWVAVGAGTKRRHGAVALAVSVLVEIRDAPLHRALAEFPRERALFLSVTAARRKACARTWDASTGGSTREKVLSLTRSARAKKEKKVQQQKPSAPEKAWVPIGRSTFGR